jgi:hypothetical protein
VDGVRRLSAKQMSAFRFGTESRRMGVLALDKVEAGDYGGWLCRNKDETFFTLNSLCFLWAGLSH